MYIAKIPGTKYVTSLESQGGDWYLRLKLDSTVEAEIALEQLSKRSIHTKLNELFDQVRLQINSFQVDLIHKELVAQIAHLLIQDQTSSSEQKPEAVTSEGVKHDPRVDKLFDRIDELEGILKTLSDRVERMEAISK